MRLNRIKILFIGILFSLSIACFGQEYPDSGFTNKAEAKNLTINGLKEGKWFEQLDGGFHVITDTAHFKVIIDTNGKLNPNYICYYSLTMYKAGKHNGITRWYFTDWTLWSEYPYIDDVLNGNYREYYDNGKVKKETPFTNNKPNGLAKEYYDNGQIETQKLFKNGTLVKTTNFDTYGNEIK